MPDECHYECDSEGIDYGPDFYTCEIWIDADDGNYHIEIMHPTRGDEPMDEDLGTADLDAAMSAAVARFTAWIEQWIEDVQRNNEEALERERQWEWEHPDED